MSRWGDLIDHYDHDDECSAESWDDFADAACICGGAT